VETVAVMVAEMVVVGMVVVGMVVERHRRRQRRAVCRLAHRRSYQYTHHRRRQKVSQQLG
jgi:hypothetical protein